MMCAAWPRALCGPLRYVRAGGMVCLTPRPDGTGVRVKSTGEKGGIAGQKRREERRGEQRANCNTLLKKSIVILNSPPKPHSG